MHKTSRSSTTYRPFEVKHEKRQKPSILSNNPEMELDFVPFLLSACVYTAVFIFLAVRYLRRHDVAAD